VAETVGEARQALHGTHLPDLVIADWLLPDGEGLDLLRSEPVRAMPPVVIMTSHGSERVAVEAIRAGAVDYVVKSETALADLPHMAERAVRHRRIEQALGDLVAGTAASGGEALFSELVLRLAQALRVKYASVAQIVAPGRVRTLARSVDGRLMPAIEYALEVWGSGQGEDRARFRELQRNGMKEDLGWDRRVAVEAARVPARLRLLQTGYVDAAHLRGFLGGALVVAYPSFGEGFGLPVLEAMACGAPVLTTQRLALPEVGGDAVAYTEPDSESIAAALTALLDDAALRASIAAAGLKRSARFTWAASAGAHLESYARAASGGS